VALLEQFESLQSARHKEHWGRAILFCIASKMM